MQTPATLVEWLEYIERIHPKSIELGLDRVLVVKRRLARRSAATIVTVAGTNGKGSTCAMLESVLLAAGHRVGMYSSPHLLRYNERVRVNGAPVEDASLCRAFEQVEAARDGVALTYFEFGTLAAWIIFAGEPLDALILEVGMGGRLDAVNAFDADCAVLTSIAIDHMDYLGPTREQIGLEKAGIFRAGRPAIVSDPEPPGSVIEPPVVLPPVLVATVSVPPEPRVEPLTKTKPPLFSTTMRVPFGKKARLRGIERPPTTRVSVKKEGRAAAAGPATRGGTTRTRATATARGARRLPFMRDARAIQAPPSSPFASGSGFWNRKGRRGAQRRHPRNA